MKERFNLIQALTYLKEGKKVRNIKNNQTLWFDEYGLLRDNDNEDDVNRYVLNIHCKGLIIGNAWELYEEPKPILDIEEKTYLEGVLRPFKDRITNIYKVFMGDCEYLVINFKSAIYNNCEESFSLPYFKPKTMYKNMEILKKYTLKELGLFDRKIY